MTIKKLNSEDRMKLIRFICSFAWADLEIHDKERTFVRNLAKKLGLDADELRQMEKWLTVPPKAEEVDPANIPLKHRQMFLDEVRNLITIDGTIDDAERENFELLEQLIR